MKFKNMLNQKNAQLLETSVVMEQENCFMNLQVFYIMEIHKNISYETMNTERKWTINLYSPDEGAPATTGEPALWRWLDLPRGCLRGYD